jgi:putative inorganic carbon (hco3(-)) transporter
MVDERMANAKHLVNTKWRRLRAQGVLIWIAALLAGWLIETLMKTRPPLILAGVSIVFLFFLVFLERPDLGLFFVLITRSFTDLSALGRGSELGSVALMQPNVGLSIILIVGGSLFIMSHRAPFLSLPGGTILVLLLLTGLVAMLRAESPLYSFYHWLRVATVLFPYALAAYLFRTPQRVLRMVDVLAISFAIPAAYGLWQFVSRSGYYQEGTGVMRIQGTFVHPNAFGIFLVVFLAVFFCQARVQSGIRKLAAIVIVGAAAFLIAMTYARVAWVGALVVMLTVGILAKRPAVVLLPLLAVVALFTIPGLSNRAADLTTIFQPGGGGSLQGRYEIWESAYSDWLGVTEARDSTLATALNRLAGTGPGAINYHTARGGAGEAYAAHNDYLAILSDYGIFGLSMYLMMFCVLIVFAFRTWKATRGTVMEAIPLSLVALLLAILAMSLTDNIFEATQNQLYVWTLAGLAVAVKRLSLAETAVEPGQDEELGSRRLPAPARRVGRPRPSSRRGLAVE